VIEAKNASGVWSKTQYGRFGVAYHQYNQTGGWSKTIRRWATSNNFPSIEEPYTYAQATTSASKPPVWSYFDQLGRQVATVTQDIKANHIYQYSRYDQFGRAIATSLPHYSVAGATFNSVTYDIFGRMTASSAASGTTLSVEYSDNSVETSTTFMRDGRAITQSQTQVKNAFGQSITVIDNAKGKIEYSYDVFGKLERVTNVDGKDIVTTHDKMGRKIKMVDLDKGTWTYQYNALGELIEQTNAKLQKTYITYDDLGRKTKRIDDSGISTWEYGDNDGDSTLDNGLLVASSEGESSARYQYDDYRRISRVTKTLDSQVFVQRMTYDEVGRVFQQFDATGDFHGIRNHYKNGYLYQQQEARDGVEGKIYSQTETMDALGNVTQFTQGNGALTTKTYDLASGFLTDLSVNSNGVGIINNTYQFDGIGNLLLRQRNSLQEGASVQVNGTTHNAWQQAFDYDALNRLTTVGEKEQVRYAANGNITWKFDVNNGKEANYCYNDALHRHAVSGLDTGGGCDDIYRYDKNGNMTRGRTSNIIYGAFDKATSITNFATQTSTDFVYDSNRSRYKRTDIKGGVTTTTFYVGSVEVVSKSDSNVLTYRRNLPGAIALVRSNGTRDLSYLHKDHLGSIDTITDKNGQVTQLLYFDPWGKKAVLDNELLLPSLKISAVTLSLAQVLDITPRGFTGHESIDHADIIHMNGRIYDAVLGRFMQADPIIQAPGNSQSYNRYAYVFNNPLSFTDPSGFSAWTRFRDKLRPYVGVIVAVVGAWICGPTCSKAGWMLIGATSGAASAAANGGNIIEGALWGAFTAGAGTYGYAAAAIAGGIASKGQGGNFGHGFWAAGVGAKIGGGYGKGMAKVITAAVVGGTISKLTGGKFKNGAVSAAFAAAVAADWGGSNGFNGDTNTGQGNGTIKTSGSISVGEQEFNYETIGNEGYAETISDSLTTIAGTAAGVELLSGIIDSGASVTFEFAKGALATQGEFFGKNSTIFFDPSRAEQIVTSGNVLRAARSDMILSHELYHAWNNGVSGWFSTGGARRIGESIYRFPPQEAYATRYTNVIRGQLGYGYIRTHYLKNGHQYCVDGC